MTPELQTLSLLSGVVGVCFHAEHQVIFNNLPPAYGTATAEALCRSVSRSLGTYRNAGRNVEQAFFQFPQSCVLVVASPHDNGHYLTFLVQDQTSVPKLLDPARAFLARQPKDLAVAG
jgi:hypothetical protein